MNFFGLFNLLGKAWIIIGLDRPCQKRTASGQAYNENLTRFSVVMLPYLCQELERTKDYLARIKGQCKVHYIRWPVQNVTG